MINKNIFGRMFLVLFLAFIGLELVGQNQTSNIIREKEVFTYQGYVMPDISKILPYLGFSYKIQDKKTGDSLYYFFLANNVNFSKLYVDVVNPSDNVDRRNPQIDFSPSARGDWGSSFNVRSRKFSGASNRCQFKLSGSLLRDSSYNYISSPSIMGNALFNKHLVFVKKDNLNKGRILLYDYLINPSDCSIDYSESIAFEIWFKKQTINYNDETGKENSEDLYLMYITNVYLGAYSTTNWQGGVLQGRGRNRIFILPRLIMNGGTEYIVDYDDVKEVISSKEYSKNSAFMLRDVNSSKLFKIINRKEDQDKITYIFDLGDTNIDGASIYYKYVFEKLDTRDKKFQFEIPCLRRKMQDDKTPPIFTQSLVTITNNSN